MNSFFIQPTIDEKTRTILADQIHQATQKSRIESEVWQSEATHTNLVTALEYNSPTIIAVGSRAWLDRIITETQAIRNELPVFGYIDFGTKRYNPLTAFLINRKITQSIGALAARKVSLITPFHLNQSLFTESCSISSEQSDGTFLTKMSLQVNTGQMAVTTQASIIDVSIIESLQDEAPLLRLGVRTELPGQSTLPVRTGGLLPEKRTSLSTNRYEDALHIPILSGTIISGETLISTSHPGLRFTSPLNIKPSPQKLRIITSKNQPIRY